MTRRLDAKEIADASKLLSRAFQNDPLQSYVFPDAQRRAALSPAHFEPLIRYGLAAGEVWTTEGSMDGVAVWWPPEHVAVDPQKLEEAGFSKLAENIGDDATRRFVEVLEYVEPFHREDMPHPHWYAMVIGVEPAMHRKGVGSRLLQPILSRADADNVPCYLETFQPANVPFYRKHGFTVVREGTERKSGLRYWTFRR